MKYVKEKYFTFFKGKTCHEEIGISHKENIVIHHDLKATRCKLYNANIDYFHLKFTCFTLIIKKLEILRFMSSLIFLFSSVIFHKNGVRLIELLLIQKKDQTCIQNPVQQLCKLEKHRSQLKFLVSFSGRPE